MVGLFGLERVVGGLLTTIRSSISKFEFSPKARIPKFEIRSDDESNRTEGLVNERRGQLVRAFVSAD